MVFHRLPESVSWPTLWETGMQQSQSLTAPDKADTLEQNVKELGNQVSNGSLIRTWWFSLFCPCSKRPGKQIATSIGPRGGQGAQTEAYHWPIPHTPSSTGRYSCLKGMVGKGNTVNFTFSMANRHWYVWYKSSGWSNTGIKIKCDMKSLL